MERTNWAGFAAAERDFAAAVERRFTAYTHHVLATLRRDGSPRLTGIEATFRDGELWLGMMPGSRKALDLRRDGRCSLMANPGPDTAAMLADGDARIAGRAVETTDEAAVRRYLRGQEPAPEVFHLFRVEPTEVVTTGVDGDRLVLRSWTPARGLVTIRRGNGEEPVEVEH
ncbi:pyridoxamine 5'-phosphate oxidase family protein [Streptomyces sp. XM4193]|uniref:pyridoxamine 5'-phosphate oxidase family protein n=1 Tax=Streptomyces sp. XM4193 TaxID=2929782 RepID=UPI001FFA36A1|nr:pyridoxamine 5'-phosphate oxidase family protein [Streptomyces sp. XM4193]MCK1798421.1 pyridoxamine 5'-phosphate oxidase family protein [Streptomyces sp. XM4193]